MNYKLVALDIDGTILTTQGKLSIEVRKAILAAQAKGIKVTLATGRRIPKTLPLAKELGITIPVVCHNGAVIVEPDSGNIFFQQGIPLPIANQITKELSDLQIPYLLYRSEDHGDLGYLLSKDYHHTPLFLEFVDDQVYLDEWVEITKEPLKLAVLAPNSQMQPLISVWGEKYGAHANITIYQSDQYMGVDFVARGCSKASGIASVLAKFNLGFKDVLAIGDSENDLELIKAAGLGVAMDNGSTLVKAAAKYLAPSNDQHGVAHVLKTFLN